MAVDRHCQGRAMNPLAPKCFSFENLTDQKTGWNPLESVKIAESFPLDSPGALPLEEFLPKPFVGFVHVQLLFHKLRHTQRHTVDSEVYMYM